MQQNFSINTPYSMDINPPKTLNSPSIDTTDNIKSLDLKIDQHLEAKIIKSNIAAQTLVFKTSHSPKPVQVQSNLPIDAKPGQTIQLVVVKTSPNVEFKILASDPKLKTVLENKPFVLNEITLKQLIPTKTLASPPSSLISAKIIAVNETTIQLRIQSSEHKDTPQQTRAASLPPFLQGRNKEINIFKKDNIVTLKKEDIISSESQLKAQTIEYSRFKSGQKIQLFITCDIHATPKFKIINPPTEKLSPGQVVNATVINIKNNKVQLQLNNQVSNDRSGINNASIITLNKDQLQTPSKDNQQLKIGQSIKFQVVKTGARPEFILIKNESSSITKQKIQETIQHALPIQQPPSDLVNQLIKSLPNINKDESISNNLKRLAREILDNIPKTNITKNNHQQLKKSFLNSGLFLEKNLSQTTEDSDSNLQIDFKSQLLKLNQALKQQIDVNNQQKPQASEIELLKEMQQKTEGALAKIILNQLSSLPKEDGVRQSWILDLPFFNKEFAEPIKIEINRGQQNKEDKNQENWSVTITITPPGLGTIHCKVSSYDNTVNTLFWSDTEDVVAKINMNLDHLKTQFEKAGLDAGHMSAHTQSAKSEAIQNLSTNNLFDKKI